MLDLYVWTTPNGRKPLILLEELGLDYQAHGVNLGKGEQFAESYLSINPNGKIPALRDSSADVTVWESAAILTYLEETYGQGRFLPEQEPARSRVLTWCYFQMGAVGPYFGQAFHFKSRDDEPYALKRYLTEVERLFGVLDGQLATREYIAGDYSLADMLTYPWAVKMHDLGFETGRWPHVDAWLERVGERPAVQRAMAWKP